MFPTALGPVGAKNAEKGNPEKMSMQEFRIDNKLQMHTVDMGINSADVTAYPGQLNLPPTNDEAINIETESH